MEERKEKEILVGHVDIEEDDCLWVDLKCTKLEKGEIHVGRVKK